MNNQTGSLLRTGGATAILNMGEYAKYQGREIKIGTCEDMLYLRADQARSVEPMRGNVDPVKDAGAIRFRFPFPQEDGKEPGSFEPFVTLGVYGVEVPDGVDHGTVQFSSQHGLLASLPCPESKAGKESGIRFHYNGYSGKVKIAQQRLIGEQLVLVCQCGSCGTPYRYPTLEDAQPVIDALLRQADETEQSHQRNKRQDDAGKDPRAEYFREVARRITAGYIRPNAWSREAQKRVEALAEA